MNTLLMSQHKICPHPGRRLTAAAETKYDFLLLPLEPPHFTSPTVAPLLSPVFPLSGFGGAVLLAGGLRRPGPPSVTSWPGSCSPLSLGLVPSWCLGLWLRPAAVAQRQSEGGC